jgi:hypothetical protein
MLFRLAQQYVIRGIKKGNRSLRDHYVIETMEMDIPVVSADDAPVAVMWNDAVPVAFPRGNDTIWRAYSADGQQHTRWYMGSHWKRCLESDLIESHVTRAVPPLTVDALVANIEDQGGNLLTGASTFRYQPEKRGTEIHDPLGHFSSIEKSDRDTALAKIEEQSADLMIVDDVVYVRCAEPKVCVIKEREERFNNGPKARQFLKVLTSAREIADAQSRYTANQFQLAVDDLHLFSDRALAASHEAVAVNVAMPETIDDEAHMVAQLEDRVDEVYQMLHGVPFHRFSAKMLEGVVALNKAVLLNGPAMVDAVEEALALMAANWELRAERTVHTKLSYNADMGDHLRETLAMVAERPVAVELGALVPKGM